jgi:hypothetical protein
MPPRTKTTPAASAAGKNGHGAARVIDLGAAKAARAEAQNEPVVLKWDDKTSFTLPVEMPADFALLASEGDLRGAVTALIGDQAQKFFELRPSMEDLTALAELAGSVYGLTAGEAPASDDS